MNLKILLKTPFPRPKWNKRNTIWIFSAGMIASLFIIIFEPFDIENTYGIWFYNLQLLSMGVVFSASVFFMEFIIPKKLHKRFKFWNLGKAMIWYIWIWLFVGTIMFLYKSLLEGFIDFTLLTYGYVLARILGIGIITSFFTLGIFNYSSQKNISLLAQREIFTIRGLNAEAMKINIDDLLYLASEDNYVKIHFIYDGQKKETLFRSSLKNIEDQIATSLTPIYRCHRKFLININHFQLINTKARNTTIQLEIYGDEIKVSASYEKKIRELLTVHQ